MRGRKKRRGRKVLSRNVMVLLISLFTVGMMIYGNPLSLQAAPETWLSEDKMEGQTKKQESLWKSPEETQMDTGGKSSGTPSTAQRYTSSNDNPRVDAETQIVEEIVPIYNYDIINVLVPVKFRMALNPYELSVRMKDDTTSTDQVLSSNYGIVNKSTTDKIVTVTLTVEDLNGDQIVFVDSAEEAENAEDDVYAVYLAMVPADSNGITIGGDYIKKDIGIEELLDVDMSRAEDCAVVLHKGETQFSFKLERASYDFQVDDLEDSETFPGKLRALAPTGRGVTAFTFSGAMNRKADWTKLLKGIKISAMYTYETSDGSETIVDGTWNMIFTENDGL